MSKYADIEPIIKKIKYSMEVGEQRGYIWLDMVLKDLEKLPTADVVPVIYARLLDPNPYGLCSHCNYLIDIRDEFNYCPKCGAMLKIDEVTE